MGTVLAVIGYVLLGLLALVLLLPLFPVFVRVTFEEDLWVRVYLLGLPIVRFSPKTDETAPPPEPAADKPGTKPQKIGILTDLSRSLKEDGVKAVVHHITELARIAGGVLRRVFKALTVDRLILDLTVASGDAADTAQNCGKVCAVLYPALSALQLGLRIRHRAVTVTPDFLAEKGRMQADVTIHAVPYRVLFAALLALPAFLKWRKTLKPIQEEEQVNG